MTAQETKTDNNSYEALKSYNPEGSDLRNVQCACLEILKKFREVCEKNHLRYYLAYGTLLGAKRHAGFIPWDDDIDVWMPRPDMERFLETCQEQMAPYTINFYTIDNDAFIRYRSQPCIEDHARRVGINIGGTIHAGYIWIDIMPLDGMPDSASARKIQCRLFRFWYMIIGFSRSSITGAFNPASKKGLKKFGMLLNDKLKIGKLFPIIKCLDAFEKLRKKYSFEDSRYIVGTTTTYTDKGVFLKKWFEGKRLMEYEGELFSVPSQTEKVLKRVYGDYMKLPPEESRKGSHFQVLNIEGKIDEKTGTVSD